MTFSAVDPHGNRMIVCLLLRQARRPRPCISKRSPNTTASVTRTSLSSVTVHPKTVVNVALQRKRAEAQLGDAFDRVYCVFDRNGHANFESASDRAKRAGVQFARSWPCFEYWLLLHFRYTRKPYRADGTRSSCDLCIEDLMIDMPDYGKAQDDVFERLRNQCEQAKARGRQQPHDPGGPAC